MATATATPPEENQLLTELLQTITAVKQGDFTARMPLNHTGLGGKVADTLNELVGQNQKMVKEFQRIGTVVGKQGKLAQRASVESMEGDWRTGMEALNTLIEDLVQPQREITNVLRAVTNGDLSRQVPLEMEEGPLKGELLKMANLTNTMVSHLSTVTKAAIALTQEMGNEGKLGGKLELENQKGSWKELTDSINLMAGNLTAQVRNISEVSTAIAQGDLSQKVSVDAQGEILELKQTMNFKVDQLNSLGLLYL